MGLTSIFLSDVQVNLYDLVPKAGYLMHCTWDGKDTLLGRKGSTSIMMDDVDHLESAVDGFQESMYLFDRSKTTCLGPGKTQVC